MIRDAASSSACSGASAGGSALPSDGSPQIQPARPRSGPHSAAPGSLAPGSLAPGSLAPADSVLFTPPVSPRAISTSNHLTSKYLRPGRTAGRRWSCRFNERGVLPNLLGRTPRSLTGNAAAGAELTVGVSAERTKARAPTRRARRRGGEAERRRGGEAERRRGGGGAGCDGDHTG